MIATLLITVCLNLMVCEEVSPPLEEGASCQGIDGEIAALHWLDDHPKWHLIPGWRCRYGTPERQA